MKAPKRKRIYLINRDFQLRYSFAAALVGIVSTLVSGALLVIPLVQFEIIRVPHFLPPPIFAAIGLAAILNIILVALLGVFITHRIAGPMYALVRCFRRIENGHWAGHLKVRDSDDLRYLVRNFNQVVDALVGIGRSDLKTVGDVMTSLNDGDVEAAKQTLQSMQDSLEKRLTVSGDLDD